MKTDQAVSLLKKLAIMVISSLIGAVSIIPIARGVKHSGNPIFEWVRSSPFELFLIIPLLLLSLVSSFVAAVAAHEFGHVLAGWWARFRFAFLLFWPIQVRRRGKRGISIRTMFRSGMGLGGVAGMTPEPGIDLRRGYLTLLAGGPAASLFCGLAGIGLFLAFRNTFPLAMGWLWTFSIFSIFLFVTSMVPSHAGGFLSDGAALRLLRHGSPHEVGPYLASLEISSAWATGARPANWNPDSIACITAVDPNDPLATRAPYFAFLNAADRGDLAEATIWMEKMTECIDEVPLLLRPQYLLMNAWLKARTGSPEVARELLAQSHGGLVDASEIAMVEAVILQAEGKQNEARNRAREALALIEKSMMPDAQAFSRHQCESILA